MRPLLKCLHQLGVIGFMGALAAQLVLVIAAGDAGAQLSWRQAAAHISGWLVMPALLLAILTGMLLMMAHPAFIAARWVWAKALLGMVVGAVLFFGVQTAVNQALQLAGAAAESADAALLQQALRTECLGGWTALAVSAVAVALAVWRPRLAASGQNTDAG
jgi:hypothetical protein